MTNITNISHASKTAPTPAEQARIRRETSENTEHNRASLTHHTSSTQHHHNSAMPLLCPLSTTLPCTSPSLFRISSRSENFSLISDKSSTDAIHHSIDTLFLHDTSPHAAGRPRLCVVARLKFAGWPRPVPGECVFVHTSTFPPTFACASGMSGVLALWVFPRTPDMDASALALCLTAWLLPVPSLLGVAPFLYPTVMLMQFLRPVRVARLCSISVCGVCRVGVLRCICRETLGASGSRDRGFRA